MLRYSVPTLAIGGTAAVQLSLFGASAPWFLYTPVVVSLTLLLGSGVGVWSTILAALAAGCAVGGLDRPILLAPVHWVASIIFFLTTLGLVALVQALREALLDSDVLRAARERDLVDTAEREAFLASVLAASTDCIKVVELDGSLSFMSENGMAVMEIGDFNAVRGCPWPDFLSEGGVGLARDAIEAARQGRSTHFESPADTYIGTPKWWSVSVSPIRDTNGSVSRILSVSRDHTALCEARQQQQLLNGELAHRLKNMLALVQSIANQTLRDGATPAVTLNALSARIAALGHASDVLITTSWSDAELHAVAAAALAPIAHFGDRISISGPQVNLSPQATTAITLALHELATNAVKYGALSNDAGKTTLEWNVRDHDGQPTFQLRWREQGGPIVRPPTRTGFGTRMIERSLRPYFHGKIVLSYPPEGFEFEIGAALDSPGLGTTAAPPSGVFPVEALPAMKIQP